jgi:tRNA (adenine-N(1)-)-methyltransferase non-catalytic subunit
MYYGQGPAKINNLRVDTLSQMLTFGNVRSGGKYMVVDNSMGLVTAAIMDRMVGNGSLPIDHDPGNCIQIFTEQGPFSTWRQSVDALNLPPDVVTKCLLSLQINGVNELLNPGQGEDKDLGEQEEDPNRGRRDCTEEEMNDPKRKKLDERGKRRAERKAEMEKARELLGHRAMDGLLMVTRNIHPENVLNLLMNFLAPSSPFVVFCNVMQPLVDCWVGLKGRAVNVRLHENWMRKFQVLPERTRPEMNMSGSGGYLLAGIKVEP